MKTMASNEHLQQTSHNTRELETSKLPKIMAFWKHIERGSKDREFDNEQCLISITLLHTNHVGQSENVFPV